MLGHHNSVGTWHSKVDAYIVLTRFMKAKLVEGGLPSEKMHVKPNFVSPDPGPKSGEGEFALFVGRLAPEKGVLTLLEAWGKVGPAIPLEIVGTGPLGMEAERAAGPSGNIRVRGPLPHAEVFALMKRARYLVFPSEWYEGFPVVVAEAFANGLPVLASRIGSAAEIVRGGATGWHFVPGSAEDLAARAAWMWDHPRECLEAGRVARSEYEAFYSADENYGALLGIYEKARAGRARGD
jgi:glycosyltransferase involved in cell wall biosynthesis